MNEGPEASLGNPKRIQGYDRMMCSWVEHWSAVYAQGHPIQKKILVLLALLIN